MSEEGPAYKGYPSGSALLHSDSNNNTTTEILTNSFSSSAGSSSGIGSSCGSDGGVVLAGAIASGFPQRLGAPGAPLGVISSKEQGVCDLTSLIQ